MLPQLRFESINASNIPTPLHRIDAISDILGVSIYIKRDDLTGFAFGGNKTRKLDFLVADALAKNCDTLIAIGGPQSNFCRLAAAYGARFGLKVHLVLSGTKPSYYTGNSMINELLGAQMHFVGEDITKKRAWELEQNLITEGKRPYRMPSGGSIGVGILGYVKAIQEIQLQSQEMNLTFDYLFHASGSGGTQAGLLVGKQLLKIPTIIRGISVGRDKESLAEVIKILSDQTFKLLGIEEALNESSIFIDDEFIGDGYGQKTLWGQQAIELLAKKESIFLDHIYTGKAFAALLDSIYKEKIEAKSNILFLHTGGNVQLFA